MLDVSTPFTQNASDFLAYNWMFKNWNSALKPLAVFPVNVGFWKHALDVVITDDISIIPVLFLF